MKTFRRWGCCIIATKDDIDNDLSARPKSEEWVAKMNEIRFADHCQRTPTYLDKPLPSLPVNRRKFGVSPVNISQTRALRTQSSTPEGARVRLAKPDPLPELGEGSSQQSLAARTSVDEMTRGSIQEERDAEHVDTTNEDGDSYTTRSMRMVPAHDGVKDCAALLMTQEFSQEVRMCVELQRELSREERARIVRRPVDESFVRKHKARVARSEQAYADCGVGIRAAGKTFAMQPETANLQAEIDEARILLDEAEARYQAAETSLLHQADELKKRQCRVLRLLEEAFVQDGLLEPDERLFSSVKGLNLCLRSAQVQGRHGRPERPSTPDERLESTGVTRGDTDTQAEILDESRQTYPTVQDHFRAAQKNLNNYDILRTREREVVALGRRNGQPTPDDTSETSSSAR